MQPTSVRDRSEVGMGVNMVVTASNVRGTTINTATLTIYYPDASSETGDLFFLLPSCMVEAVCFRLRLICTLLLQLLLH